MGSARDHDLPCGLLDVAGYYGELIAFLDGAVEAGFVSAADRRLLTVAEEPTALLDAFEAYEPPDEGEGSGLGVEET